jgi:copper(I)-binding protein
MINGVWPKGIGLLVGMMIFQSVAWADASISIENAWVRDAPPHAEMSAGYLTIMNHSDQIQTLTSVSSPQYQKVEAHKTEMVNGQVRMLREDNVTVPAHGSLEFKPGGYHLMMIHPLHELKLGDKVELRLQFKGSQPLSVDAQIREAADETPPHDMHKMHDMNM